VTRKERIDREAFLRRAAALAGAVYVSPVLSSTAGAEAEACSGQRCSRSRKCRRRGGPGCKCVDGRCRPTGCQCIKEDSSCGLLEACGGNCGCFFNAKRENPGHCVDLRDGLCSSFEPCDEQGNCPPGQVCFATCGCENLCGDCCTGSPGTVPPA
jgi:hypothetical protein